MAGQSTINSIAGSIGSSIGSGMAGYVRGAIALGVVLGAVGLVSGLLAAGFEMGALTTALSSASFGLGLGGLIGAVTGVMQNREKAAPDAQDIINVANISFAQGVSAGKSQSVSEPSKEEAIAAGDHFRKQLATEKNSELVAAR